MPLFLMFAGLVFAGMLFVDARAAKRKFANQPKINVGKVVVTVYWDDATEWVFEFVGSPKWNDSFGWCGWSGRGYANDFIRDKGPITNPKDPTQALPRRRVFGYQSVESECWMKPVRT